MSYIWIIIETVIQAIEVALLFFFCAKMTKLSERFKVWHFILAGCIATIISGIATYINPYSIWKTILSTVIIVLIGITFFGNNLAARFVNSLIFCSILIISDILGAIVVTIANNSLSWSIVFEESVVRLAMFCIAKIITTLIITLILHYRNKEKSYLPTKLWYLFLFLFSILLSVAILVMEIGILTDRSTLFVDVALMSIMLIFLLFYISTYYLFYRITEHVERSQQLSMLEYQNEAIEKYFIQTQEANRMIRILSHDLKHSMLSWKELYCDKGYRESMEHILEYEQAIETTHIVDVGNELANAIIYQKLLFATKNDINISVRGTFYKDLNISKIDLCSLLGNLLDNAIEANLKIENSDNRKIAMKIKRSGNLLFLELENNYIDEPVVQNGNFVSQKKNRVCHGIGMISINNVVTKYDGVINNTYNRNIFKTSIMLKAYTENIKNEFYDKDKVYG